MRFHNAKSVLQTHISPWAARATRLPMQMTTIKREHLLI
jgi:hypothetical protein